MFKILNIFEIVSDYLTYMKEDLKLVPFFVNLILIPLALTAILYLSVTDIKRLANMLIIITSIFVPLLLNILLIVHYSVERTKNSPKKVTTLKIEFLQHINATASMVILLSMVILFLSIIILNFDVSSRFEYLSFFVKCIFFLLVAFMFINILITLIRTYRLIKYEIQEQTGNIDERG